MRAQEFISEIERLEKGDYEGGKGELSYFNTPRKNVVKPLPGGSGFEYAIRTEDSTRQTIFIVDPAASTKPVKNRWDSSWDYAHKLDKWSKSKKQSGPAIVAKLSIYKADIPIKDAVQVGSITVDEDYRGKGLAKALYGIVLSIMKKTLVAGGEQTPGGRRNWMSLASIPGVEVKGFVQIDKDDLNYDPSSWYSEKQIDKHHDNLMSMGGQFIGQDKWAEYWAFDVVPSRNELKQAVNTPLNKLYDRGDATTGMFAVWTGK